MVREENMVEESVWIPVENRQLEGALAYPERESPHQGVLLLSPHPHMGGRMDNNVIAHLARRFAEEGAVTLRFNYGGIGKSEGTIPEDMPPYEYWERLERTQAYGVLLPEVVAARGFLASALPPDLPITYVGYSFGCCLAIQLAVQHPPAQLALVSAPLSKAPLTGLESLRNPVLFLSGENDFVLDRDRLQTYLVAMPHSASYSELASCDHFYRKDEERLYQTLLTLLPAELRRTGPP